MGQELMGQELMGQELECPDRWTLQFSPARSPSQTTECCVALSSRPYPQDYGNLNHQVSALA
jgi:hypothetical protein